MFLQIHVKFLLKFSDTCSFIYFLFIKKGPEKAILSTDNETCMLTHFHIISYLCKKGLQKAIMGTATTVLACYGYLRNSLNSHICDRPGQCGVDGLSKKWHFYHFRPNDNQNPLGRTMTKYMFSETC